MATNLPSKIWRLAPSAEIFGAAPISSVLSAPAELIQLLRPRHGILLASWDPTVKLGRVAALGIARRSEGEVYWIDWRGSDVTLRPNPSGEVHWQKSKPFFEMKGAVRDRYMLDDLFAEAFPDIGALTFGRSPMPAAAGPRSSLHPTSGYVYVIRSSYGFKIGKTVNLKERTRLFEVKLPFKISVEHYAWFEDYTAAERDFHRRFHDKRLEGEWFDLSPSDIEYLRSQGQPNRQE